jgi:CHASE3 domain sensor protein
MTNLNEEQRRAIDKALASTQTTIKIWTVVVIIGAIPIVAFLVFVVWLLLS